MSLPIKWVGASDNFTRGRSQQPNLIVMHWIVGTLASADATFTNPARQASAHYGVNGEEIHQYVKESDTAWANGHSNPALNTNGRSISIEHEGGWMTDSGIRFQPSHATHEMSARLVAYIVTRHPQIKLDRQHIRKHNEVSDSGTECPGSLDVNWIIERAKEILGGQDMTIVIKQISKLKVTLKKPIMMYDFEHNKELHHSGAYMELVQKTNPVHGYSFLVPEDRAKKGQLYGFRDVDVFAKGNKIHDTQFDAKQPELSAQDKQYLELGRKVAELAKGVK